MSRLGRSGGIAILLPVLLAACTSGGTVPRVVTPGSISSSPPAAPSPIGSVRALAGMKVPRAAQAETTLLDGRVLITGGFGTESDSDPASTELFDPATDRFTFGPSMTAPRYGHSATLLSDGQVLIAGGFSGSGGEVLDSAEVYDPATERFIPTGRMLALRADHEAVLLQDGRVLIVGGTGLDFDFLESAEIYNPGSGAFTATGPMSVPREGFTATLLQDGRVLVAGGHVGRHEQREIYASAELYDPGTGHFTPAGNMTIPRHKHDAVLLADGRVLIVAGADASDDAGLYDTAETYDPVQGRFEPTGELNDPRYKFRGTSILLPDHRVLVAGGATFPEVYQPDKGTFTPFADPLGRAPFFATAALLPDGTVMLCGGYSSSGPSTTSAWILRP